MPRSCGGEASGGIADVPTPVSALIAALSQGDEMLTTPLPAAAPHHSATVRARGL